MFDTHFRKFVICSPNMYVMIKCIPYDVIEAESLTALKSSDVKWYRQ